MNDKPNFPPTLPPEAIVQYVNSCDAVEMLYGIRHLEGVRVRAGREVALVILDSKHQRARVSVESTGATL